MIHQINSALKTKTFQRLDVHNTGIAYRIRHTPMHDESDHSNRFYLTGLQHRSLKLLPLKLAGAYFLVAGLWIFVAHSWLPAFFSGSATLTHLLSLEDLLFVSLTAWVLYWLARRSLRTLQQVETTLRHSEERVRLILQNMPVMLNAFDEQGNIITWNHECEQVTGYSAEEIIGKPQAMTWLYPDAAYRQQMIAAWAKLDGNYRNWEWDLVCKDGSRRTVAWSNFDDRFSIPGWAAWGIGVDVTDRKQAETELRRSEEFLKLALDFTYIGSWDWHVPTNEVIWNENHARLLGLVPGEVQASYQAWRDRVHPDDVDQVEQAVTQALETRTNFEAEYRVVHPDGSLHWMVGRGRCVYDAAGQVSRMIGVIFEITDRKHAETALRESEAQFRSLSVCSPVGIYLASPEGYGTYTNPRCQEIFGFTLAESIGTGWASRVHPDDREWLFQEWSAAAAAGNAYVTEYRVQPGEGVVRWVQSRSAPMYSNEGALIGHVGTIEDITDRKHAEAQIQRLNQTLEQQNLELEALVEQRTAELLTLINTLPDYIFVVDRDTMQMPFCNDLTAQLIGWESRHQVAGKTIFECYPPALAATFAEQNHRVFETGETLHFQENYTTPLGTLNLDTYKIPLKKPNGDVYALIGSSRDITELVQARQALVDRTTQLEIVNRELESFSYSVSHDLRAPLRHVHGFVAALTQQLEQNGHLSDPTVIHYLQVIQNGSQTMGRLIDGLLTLSQVGRRQMAHAPVDLRQLVTMVLSQLPDGTAPGATADTTDNGTTDDRTTNNEQPAQFSVGDLPTVMGDATLLQQVFANLVENAIKFSRVRETSAKQNRQPAQIEIGSLPDGVIFVRDHGVGFQMEYADQLFGAFQRLHSRSEFEGNGIGLAIVQRIIHRHGGHIWAESQPDQGATFFFKLNDRSVAAQQPGYSMGLASDVGVKPEPSVQR